MSDETIDANEEIEVECAACAGDGTYETDEYSAKSGHFNRAHRCNTCDGTGKETLTRYAALDREHAQTIAEKLRLKRELNAAHARIVEQQKVIQSLRSGGDVSGAATPTVLAGAQDRIPDTDPHAVGITLGG